MLPLFRKIRKQLAEDDKPFKYLRYAIGEIALVVVGILIALQLNTWKETSNQRSKEKEVLNDIHIEFLQNKKQFDEVVSYHQRSSDNINKIMQLFPIDLKELQIDSIEHYLNNSFWRYTFNPTQSSINALIGTSSFDIIANKELRKLLISWTDVVADYQEEEITAKEIQIKIYEPYFYKHLTGELDSYDFRDPRMQLNVFKTVEFEGIIYGRKINLRDILGDELKTIQATIDRIIVLTK